jgi:signal transduction histidine kinase
MGQAFNQMMNVLEQREAELESRDAAVNMAQMKAQFAATVSHEVRTPLNGVVGMLDMLKNPPDATPAGVRRRGLEFLAHADRPDQQHPRLLQDGRAS